MNYTEAIEHLELVQECEKDLEKAKGALETAKEALMQFLQPFMTEEVKEVGQDRKRPVKRRGQPIHKNKSSGRATRARGDAYEDDGSRTIEKYYKSPGYRQIAERLEVGTLQKEGRTSPNGRRGVWFTETEAASIGKEYMEKYGKKATSSRKGAAEMVAKAIEASVRSDRAEAKEVAKYSFQGRMLYNDKNPRPSSTRNENGMEEGQTWYRSAQYIGAAKELEIGRLGQLKERNVLQRGVWLTKDELDLIREWKKTS